MLRKLKRDKVISIVNGKDLVGVYFADTDGSEVLIECSPKEADKIIGLVTSTDKNWWCIKNHFTVANCMAHKKEIKIIKKAVVPKNLIKYLKT